MAAVGIHTALKECVPECPTRKRHFVVSTSSLFVDTSVTTASTNSHGATSDLHSTTFPSFARARPSHSSNTSVRPVWSQQLHLHARTHTRPHKTEILYLQNANITILRQTTNASITILRQTTNHYETFFWITFKHADKTGSARCEEDKHVLPLQKFEPRTVQFVS